MLPFPPIGEDTLASAMDLALRLAPEAPEGTRAALAFGLCFSGRSAREQEQFCSDLNSGAFEPRELGRRLFEDNVARLRAALGGRLPEVATIQFPCCYESHLSGVAGFLARRRDLHGIHLVSRSFLDESSFESDLELGRPVLPPSPQEHRERTRRRMRELSSLHPLVFPEPELLERFAGIDLVFVNEAQPVPWIGKGPIRVAIPHTTGFDPLYSIALWGGGAWYDVYLASREWPEHPRDQILDLYPQRMIEHGSDHFTIAPVGSPKFDELVAACQDRPRARRIAYHLTVEAIEIYQGLEERVRALLDALPDHEILLRAHPHDWNRPEIVRALEALKSHPRFLVSRSSSYVQDYADVQAVLAHKVWSVEKFPLASLRPLVVLDPGSGPARMDELGWSVGDLESAVQVLRRIDLDPTADSRRLLQERERRFLNAGRSVDALLDRLDDLRARRPIPGWERLPLRSGPDPEDPHEAFSRSIERARSLPIHRFALLQRARKEHPEDPVFQLEYAKDRLADVDEGLAHGRWQWVEGLHACLDAWRILEPEPPDHPLRSELKSLILSRALPGALAWCWNESRSNPGSRKAFETFAALLACDDEGIAPRLWADNARISARCGQVEAEFARLRARIAEPWALLGAERFALGQDGPAREALETAIEHHPGHPHALFNLMLLDRIEGRSGEALAKARKLSTLLPSDPEVAKHLRELSA